MVAFAAPFCAMMIRFGNLMNSEIIGCPTDVPWAFIFERVDMVPRHPAQLYEALFYGCVLVFGFILYRKPSFPAITSTSFKSIIYTLIYLTYNSFNGIKSHRNQ